MCFIYAVRCERLGPCGLEESVLVPTKDGQRIEVLVHGKDICEVDGKPVLRITRVLVDDEGVMVELTREASNGAWRLRVRACDVAVNGRIVR